MRSLLRVGAGSPGSSSRASTRRRARRVASTRSSTIEPRIRAPTRACCQKSGMPTVGSARLMVTSSTAPIAAPHTVPLPPKIATPPITTAATAWSSMPVPALELTLP